MGNQCDEERSGRGLAVTGSTLLLRQVAPGNEGRNGKRDRGWAESAMGRSGDGLEKGKGSVETFGDEQGDF